MSKADGERIAAIKANFQTGDTLAETSFADLIDAIAEAAEAHQHLSTGGDGTGTGDAGPVINLQSGAAAQKPASPAAGDVYVETDTSKVYICYSAGAWTEVGDGEPGAPTEASYVTINAEDGLSAETLHKNITGDDLHDPRAHRSSHAAGGSDGLTYTRQVVFYLPGTLETGSNQSAEVVYRGPTATIVRADGRVKTAPKDEAILFDVHVNGTSLWEATQANRLTIAAGATSGTQTAFDTTTISDGDTITLDTDQVGSSEAGEAATVLLELACHLEADPG
jgi:hypothetical protein